VLLVDSSVWVDYLRGLDTSACLGMRQILGSRPTEVATTEPIVMELLAGAPDDRVLGELTALTSGLPLLALDPRVDFHAAAGLHRVSRRSGRTVRALMDCLIAAVALRTGATVVHKDADYETLATVVPLATLALL
jgi:predicted nucleic acid-binding protein